MSQTEITQNIGTTSYSQINALNATSRPAANAVEDIEALRHLIGNAAHDLKTPLASFMTGTDIIMKTVQTMEEIIFESDSMEVRYSQASSSFDDFPHENDQLHATGNSVSGELCSAISTIKACLQDIINMNQFMLMSINRCIDYTKSTEGLKLKPKYDTIDLLDTLRLPILCMRNTQESCTIYMNPLNPVISSSRNNIQSVICSHIITDKQWLQENVLCLLSNAVKYSSGSDVAVTVSLLQDSRKVNNEPANHKKQSSLSVMTSTGGESPLATLHAISSVSALSSASCDTILPLPDVILTEAAFQYNTLSPNSNNNHKNIVGDFLHIEVQDCGIGVPEHLRESLFHPFKQIQKLAGGTGLGLYSLAKRIEALGGRYGVTARSDNRPGSVFYFTIPYRPDWVSHEEAIAAAAAMTASASLSSINITEEMNIPMYMAIMKIPIDNGNERKIEAIMSDSLRKNLIKIPSLDILPENASKQPLSSHTIQSSQSRRDSLNSFRSMSDENNIFSHSPSTVGTPISFISRNSRENFTVGIPPLTYQLQQQQQQYPMGKILLVEDSQTIGKMTVAVLTRQGFQVEWVVNGALALEKLCQLPVTLTNQSPTDSIHFSDCHTNSDAINSGYISSISKKPHRYTAIFFHPHSHPYDAVLMDLQMPIMDGLEATKRIRAFEEKHHIHRQVIVGLSANLDHDTIETARNVGFDAFMDKPINVDILLEIFGKFPRNGE